MIIAATMAMIMANSQGLDLYNRFISMPVGNMNLNIVVKDVLMVLFFFQIGMELKEEVKEGFLKNRDQVLLPFLAASGGIVVPALIYILFNSGNEEVVRGWAIPSATDIAFALCVLSLVAKNISPSIRIFLLAIAIFDDLGAILIIAIFYSEKLHYLPILLIGITTLVLYLLNRYNVTFRGAYLAGGIVLWFLLHKAGIHTTIAGVIVGLMIPMYNKDKNYSPLKKTSETLHPFVSFFILPLFAFVSSGIIFDGRIMNDLFNPVSLGIISGLFLGKQLGIFISVLLAIKLKIASRPEGSTWQELYLVSIIAGIGFTMSLFISQLAFTNDLFREEAKVGIVAGSLFSALVGTGFYKAVSRLSKK